jgi:ribosomal-protein-alanine N-acetyltransferase
MSESDIEEVHAIEKQCFTTPWTMNSLKHELNNKDAILKIAMYNNRIIGYVCLRTLLYTTHVFDIAVVPDFRRMGIATMLMNNVLEELWNIKPDVKTVTLEVRESNKPAIELYKKLGFRVAGRRKDYYIKPREDAIVMERYKR